MIAPVPGPLGLPWSPALTACVEHEAKVTSRLATVRDGVVLMENAVRDNWVPTYAEEQLAEVDVANASVGEKKYNAFPGPRAQTT
jgi:hypothetical protein